MQTAYTEMPDYPQSFNSGNVLGRFTDFFGFRYYWATEGLSENDLNYKPCESAKTVKETLNHIYNMAAFAKSSFTGDRFAFPEPNLDWSFEELRENTLSLIAELSEHLKASQDDSFQKELKLSLQGQNMEFPLWHAINPISDTMFHLGQIIAYRRAAGNPIDPAVQPFLGKRIEAA